ncbi:MAG: hypothetical protein R6T92_07390, partial [Desulfosalsimonadaceae bacterium]
AFIRGGAEGLKTAGATAADKDPYWNFDRLMAMEKDLGLSSVFYFLDKDLKHQDAYYRLTDKRIRGSSVTGREIGREAG